MPTSSAQRLVFPAQKKVEIESFELPVLSSDEVRVRISRSLMSTGSENIVLNGNFDKGTAWADWAKYPFYPGYAATGVVEAVGDAVDTLKVGARVACRCGHASHAIVPAAMCYAIPGRVSFEAAAWFALAKITFQALKAARYEVGDAVAILGAGPIGQMSLRWARADGVGSVMMVDPAAEREVFSQAGGADAYFAAPAGEVLIAVREALGGTSPDVVVDSTGHAVVFQSALELVREMGRVVLVGDTGSPSSQHLVSDFLRKGITLTGAHDIAHYSDWDEARIVSFFFNLVEDGRINLNKLNTHSFTPPQHAKAYETANRERAKTMGILFDWDN